MKQFRTTMLGAALAGLLLTGCGEPGADSGQAADDHDHDHDHAAQDDHGHGDEAHSDADHDHDDHHDGEHGDGHDDETPLGTAMIGDMEVECWQGHGEVEPGKEMHLVIKLPYSDDGRTVVRAWIGTEERLTSIVGKGEYAPSHDDYDVHAVAPDPLPDDAAWWIEIDKPDGTRAVGSIAFK